MKTRRIPISEFKAKALALVTEVEEKQEEIVLTRRGEPVAKVVPFDHEIFRVAGSLAGKGKIIGDILELPADTWAAYR